MFVDAQPGVISSFQHDGFPLSDGGSHSVEGKYCVNVMGEDGALPKHLDATIAGDAGVHVESVVLFPRAPEPFVGCSRVETVRMCIEKESRVRGEPSEVGIPAVMTEIVDDRVDGRQSGQSVR